MFTRKSTLSAVRTLAAIKPVLMEALDGRQHMSVVTAAQNPLTHDLTITGTSGADKINVDFVGEQGPNHDQLNAKVTIGAKSRMFYNVNNSMVTGNKGNDTITITGIDMSWMEDYHWIDVYGGDGNDVLRTGRCDGPIFINGEAGNDQISFTEAFAIDDMHGERSMRMAIGGTGNDRIYGSNDEDGLYGNEGDDIIIARDGNDNVGGGPGFNMIDLGDGDDYVTIYSLSPIYTDDPKSIYGGHDVIIDGGGNDTAAMYYNSNAGPALFDAKLSGVEITQLVDFALFGGPKG